MAIAREEFTAALARHYPEIEAEGKELRREEFAPWPLYRGYVGEWLVFPLLLRSRPGDLSVDLAANQRRCPRTTAAMRAIGALTAAFSRMEPGCRILPHRDAEDPGVLRAHLGIVVPTGAYMRLGDRWLEWGAGEVFAFDGQEQHETINLGKQPRLILMADFVPA